MTTYDPRQALLKLSQRQADAWPMGIIELLALIVLLALGLALPFALLYGLARIMGLGTAIDELTGRFSDWRLTRRYR